MPDSKSIAANRNLSTEDQDLQTGDTGKFRPYALVAKRIPTTSAARYMLSKARHAFLALIQSFDSDYQAYWETIFYSMEQNQFSVQNQWAEVDQISPSICSFSPFPRFKKYLHTPITRGADVKNHLLQLLRPSGPVTHSKSILRYFTVLNPTQNLTGF